MESTYMRSTNVQTRKFHSAHLQNLAVAALVAVCFSTSAQAQQRGQQTFPSAEAATAAFVDATKSNNEKALLEILGREGKDIVTSGDSAEDAESRDMFVKRYEEMHRLVQEPDGTTVLYIGAHNWPTPIPLVHKGSAWYFDTAAGKQEVLFRRVGRNEMSTIRICQELVAAEKEYSAQHQEFASHIFGEDAKHDGLYWKAAPGEPQSPIGPLVAAAVSGTDSKSDMPPTPYRGYYFHVLTRQGKKANGGAKDYVVDHKMTAGFAFVAYPAEYRSSGVMTFLVAEDGVVYEKDLGKKTEAVAKGMKEYDPDSSWKKTDEQLAEQASATDDK
jgi:hypothetical protein